MTTPTPHPPPSRRTGRSLAVGIAAAQAAVAASEKTGRPVDPRVLRLANSTLETLSTELPVTNPKTTVYIEHEVPVSVERIVERVVEKPVYVYLDRVTGQEFDQTERPGDQTARQPAAEYVFDEPLVVYEHSELFDRLRHRVEFTEGQDFETGGGGAASVTYPA